MTNPTPLSPAAQAVVAAIEKFDWESGHFSREEIWHCSREVVAAALRAAADQAENVYPAKPSTEWGEGWLEGVQDVVAGFRRIAAELEGAQ